MGRTGKPALICRENAPVVSTYLTVVDGSCIMKTPGEENPWLVASSYRHRGSHVLGRVLSSGEHTASQAFPKDCTVFYGDRRGIANALTVLDAGAVHGL